MASKPLEVLTRLETLAERWLEGGFVRLLGTRLHRAELAEQLIRALEDGLTAGPSGTWLAPDEYKIFLHPDDFARLGSGQTKAETEEKLTKHLIEMAQQIGVALTRRPQVHLHSSHRVLPRRVQVQARLTQLPTLLDEPFETQEMAVRQPQEMTDNQPPDTRLSTSDMLVTDTPPPTYQLLVGERCIPLTTSPINLGRGLDNDVVIDHPRISRYHAQLRQRASQWWLIDLGSTNGLTVNNQPASEAILHPGDIISLSGVEIRFEQQAPSSQ